MKNQIENNKPNEANFSSEKNSFSTQEIQKKAYEIYQERLAKGLPGDAQSDWQLALKKLETEQQVESTDILKPQDSETTQLKNQETEQEIKSSISSTIEEPIEKPALPSNSKKTNQSRKAVFVGIGAALILSTLLIFLHLSHRQTLQKPVPHFVADVVEGNVKVTLSSNNTRLSLEPGMELHTQDKIQTGEDSFCDIIMPERGIFRIEDNSQINLSVLERGKDQLKVIQGKVGLNITKKLKRKESFKVQTEVAIASVRGTQFFVEMNGSNNNIILLRGEVHLKRNLDISASENIKKLVNQELEITLTSNHTFTASKDNNLRLSKVLNSNLQNIKNLKKVKSLTKSIKAREMTKIKSIDNPQKYLKKMQQLNTPQKLDKIKNIHQTFYIYYRTGETNVGSAYTASLQKLVDTWKKNPSLKIIIKGHSDNKGDSQENLRLSQERAQAVLEYLLTKGIPRQNLSAKGYGDTLPMTANTTPEGRARNRRTELLVH